MTHQAWQYFANQIGQSNIKEVYKNQAFNQTMFCGSYQDEELKYLINHLDEDTIEQLIWEPIETMTEGNNIHQLYHLQKFIEYAGKDWFNENIVEFGGGYGSLCTRMYRLLKPKRYNIIDLPELQKLQAEYLSENNVMNVAWYDSFQDYLQFQKSSGVFIALWSLSETPQHVRDYIEENADFDYYLLAYGDAFFDIKNLDYFDKFRENRPQIKWKKEKIPFMNNQYYLMGKK